jgi:hypothetical protein
MARTSRLVAVLLALSVSFPGTALASHVSYRVYAYQTLASGTNGIDGYIRGSGIAMQHTDHAVAEWVTLLAEPPGQELMWVQTGQYQGLAGVCPGTRCISSPNRVHLYFETRSCNATVYSIMDLGAPPNPNYPVFVNWAGGSNLNDCGTYGGSWYFPFRIGSWTSQPKGTGRLNQSWGYPEAALESRYLHGRSPEDIGLVWFGLDNNAQVNNGYGLHLYTRATNTWNLWNQAATQCCLATVPAGIPNPLVYVPKRAWDAFQVHD